MDNRRGIKAGNRLFLWGKVGLMGSGAAGVRCRVERLLITFSAKKFGKSEEM